VSPLAIYHYKSKL